MNFKNKVVIITGAANGIGKEAARKFAAEGAKVVIADVDKEKSSQFVEEIKANGGKAIQVTVDVSDASQVKEMVKETIKHYANIDVLINNAGFSKDMLMKNMTMDDWNIVLNTSLKGHFLCAKYVSPYMIERNSGKIVNISSRSYLGNRGQVNYSSAKAGVIGLTRAMAKELGRFSINVNAVAPGLIETDRLKKHPKYEAIKDNTISESPLKRIGCPEDVVNVIMLLSSEKTSFLTGDILHVTGGRND